MWSFHGTLHNVTNIFPHPDYRFTEPPNATYVNDLALLKVNKLFSKNGISQPIPIAFDMINEGNPARLSNWGRRRVSNFQVGVYFFNFRYTDYVHKININFFIFPFQALYVSPSACNATTINFPLTLQETSVPLSCTLLGDYCVVCLVKWLFA